MRFSVHTGPGHSRRTAAERSSQTPHANRLLIAADRYISERERTGIMADRLLNRVRYQELRPEFLVEALDSGGQIHRVADHGVFLAPRRADVACHHVPKMQSDANTERPRPSRRFTRTSNGPLTWRAARNRDRTSLSGG